MKCDICGTEFKPVNGRQRSCKNPECRKAIKKQSHHNWFAKQADTSQANRNEYKAEAVRIARMENDWSSRRAAIVARRDPETKQYR